MRALPTVSTELRSRLSGVRPVSLSLFAANTYADSDTHPKANLSPDWHAVVLQ